MDSRDQENAMDAMARVERTLGEALARTGAGDCPPRLATAMRHAVFPGGARVRPRLCQAVAWGCGADDPSITDAAAASIELLHCASLVHDDLPCFDNAATRRGLPSVHAAFGETTAVLAGDALIVLAFETLGLAAARRPYRMAELVRIVARAVGAPSGITAGQAWEAEERIDLSAYHRAKTGALFAAATEAGAASAGAKGANWILLGELLGEAYQVADDVRDAAATEAEIGKPVGKDTDLNRPSATRSYGLTGALARLDDLVERAVLAVPHCARRRELCGLIRLEASKFLPPTLRRRAA
jgi:geranylgeranyl diphosphate synthase, type II